MDVKKPYNGLVIPNRIFTGIYGIAGKAGIILVILVIPVILTIIPIGIGLGRKANTMLKESHHYSCLILPGMRGEHLIDSQAVGTGQVIENKGLNDD